MQVYRLEAVIPNNGELRLKDLPFLPGETVEIIIRPTNNIQHNAKVFPLKDTILRYEEPTEPIAESDWNILQ